MEPPKKPRARNRIERAPAHGKKSSLLLNKSEFLKMRKEYHRMLVKYKRENVAMGQPTVEMIRKTPEYQMRKRYGLAAYFGMFSMEEMQFGSARRDKPKWYPKQNRAPVSQNMIGMEKYYLVAEFPHMSWLDVEHAAQRNIDHFSALFGNVRINME